MFEYIYYIDVIRLDGLGHENAFHDDYYLAFKLFGYQLVYLQHRKNTASETATIN